MGTDIDIILVPSGEGLILDPSTLLSQSKKGTP